MTRLSPSGGPWAVSRPSDNPSGRYVEIVGRRPDGDGACVVAHSVRERDASLIAAAPELLASLEQILRLGLTPGNGPLLAALRRARTAVAAAKGETP